MIALTWALLVIPVAGLVAAGLRWLLVAQREHYIPGSAVRFVLRWARSSPANMALAVLLVVMAVGAWVFPRQDWALAMACAGVALVWPIGLPVRGVAWTPRLLRVGAGWLVIMIVGLAVSVRLAGTRPGLWAGIAGGILLAGVIMDTSLLVLGPIESRLQRRWVEKARTRLRLVAPRVVAITGSYGKTTAKEYTRRVLTLAGPTVASPASFNNAMGLARAVNEQLTPDARWFVAEMGTYGPGEIAALCDWMPPEIAAITAIGPVHLERFGSLEVTLAAKAEITEHARVVVLNCDDERLSLFADDLVARGREVIRCGTSPGLDVTIRDGGGTWEVEVRGEKIGSVAKVAFPTNLAVAIGIGVAAEVPLAGITEAFVDAGAPQHRQSVTKGQAGFWIIDDTFNSNPAGAVVALEALAGLDTGRKVVVTPGMVELGKEQRAANREFAGNAAQVADDLLIVKKTNRKALLEGAEAGTARVHEFPDRDSAVEWVRANLGPGDAVLYENDLPAHYP